LAAYIFFVFFGKIVFATNFSPVFSFQGEKLSQTFVTSYTQPPYIQKILFCYHKIKIAKPRRTIYRKAEYSGDSMDPRELLRVNAKKKYNIIL